MGHEFDKGYWDEHWQRRHDATPAGSGPGPHPYLAQQTADLVAGTALDAGCGEGAEAVWLAAAGWRVTAADISVAALGRAAERAAAQGVDVAWVEADLTTWEPAGTFDLVTTHYAHPAMPQLDFYRRIGEWVAPGGTLLVVGHLHGHAAGPGHGPDHDHPPAEASVTAAATRAALDDSTWEIVTAAEHERQVERPGSPPSVLHDVVVRARRRA